MEKLLRKTGINQSLRLLLIIASFVFGSSAWGQTEITWNSPSVWKGIGKTYISYTSGDFTISASRASGSTSPTVNSTSNDFRTYAKNKFTVTSSNDNITRIVFFISSNGKKRWTDVTPDTGTPTVNTTANTTSWEGNAKAITFTVGNKATHGTENGQAGQFCIDKLVIYTSGGKTAATVTFDPESYSVETNGSITVKATTNSTSKIVYSISSADGNVSINANTGEIVAGKNPGTYTITASVAENENFTSASATCPLTVTAPAPPSYIVAAPTYYKKITSTDELAAGGTYLIVCEGAKKALSATVSTVGYTQGEKNTVTNGTAATLGEFELIGTGENYKGAPLYEFLVDNKYLSGGTTSTTISLAKSVSDKTKWMVDFDANGNVEIDSYSTFSVSDTNRGLIYQNSGKVIKHYAVSNRGGRDYSNVQLYQKVTDLAISTLTNGYATFVTDVPYVMPKGACGYAVTVAPHVGVITKTDAYKEGQPVPAQTALLIGGAPGTDYYPAVLKKDVTATYKGENYMEGKRTEEGYTNSQKGVAVFYYKLALNRASKPGFYYGAADGAAFQLTKPTTAYLAVPKNITPVNGYLIDFEGETTGIDSIGQTDGNANGAIYNLNGIRMAQPLRNLPKGVYIVNGKKVIK